MNASSSTAIAHHLIAVILQHQATLQKAREDAFGHELTSSNKKDITRNNLRTKVLLRDINDLSIAKNFAARGNVRTAMQILNSLSTPVPEELLVQVPGILLDSGGVPHLPLGIVLADITAELQAEEQETLQRQQEWAQLSEEEKSEFTPDSPDFLDRFGPVRESHVVAIDSNGTHFEIRRNFDKDDRPSGFTVESFLVTQGYGATQGRLVKIIHDEAYHSTIEKAIEAVYGAIDFTHTVKKNKAVNPNDKLLSQPHPGNAYDGLMSRFHNEKLSLNFAQNAQSGFTELRTDEGRVVASLYPTGNGQEDRAIARMLQHVGDYHWVLTNASVSMKFASNDIAFLAEQLRSLSSDMPAEAQKVIQSMLSMAKDLYCASRSASDFTDAVIDNNDRSKEFDAQYERGDAYNVGCTTHKPLIQKYGAGFDAMLADWRKKFVITATPHADALRSQISDVEKIHAAKLEASKSLETVPAAP